MKKSLLFALFVVVLAVAWRCLLFVDETQFVIVTQFGRPVRTLDEAGLYFKPPYQSSLAIDRRVQVYNPRPAEFLTSEKKNIDLDVFVCWSVKDPQKFLETVNDLAGATSRIHDMVWSKLAAEVSSHTLETLVSVDGKRNLSETVVPIDADKNRLETRVPVSANRSPLENLVEGVAHECAAAALEKYGIVLVDVKIKRIGLPDQVRDSVFERMRKERARIAQRYRSEGNEEAMKIRALADKEKTVILAGAYAEAEIVRGKAEAKATRTYSEAHQKDPQFFELMRTLEAYKKIFDEKTTILLSGDSELLKYLRKNP
ncbi:MAG: protease modulator HflC [Thermoguttaceae bacterium]